MEEKIEKFKELMEAKENCQFCLDNATGDADMHGLVYWAERVEKLRKEVADMLQPNKPAGYGGHQVKPKY